MSLKSGRKPISEKGKASPFKKAKKFGTMLDIDPVFAEAADKAGFELRWIDAKKLTENQGYHRMGWQAAKRDSFGDVEGSALLEFAFGVAPDGYIKRGSAILAKRPKEVCEMHREELRERQALYDRIVNVQEEKLKEHAKSSGVETYIDSSYDEK